MKALSSLFPFPTVSPAMSSEEPGIVPQPRNGLSSQQQLLFQDDPSLRFSRIPGDPTPKPRDLGQPSYLQDRFFAPQCAEFRRNLYPGGPDLRETKWNDDATPSGGDATDGNEDDDDDDEEDEEGACAGGEVAAIDCNSTQAANNLRSRPTETRHQERVGNYANPVTIGEPDGELFYSQYLRGPEVPESTQKDVPTENTCGFSGRKDVAFHIESGETLRAILSDPVTGALMDDAMILPCGHSFGSSGIQHVIGIVSSWWKPPFQFISELYDARQICVSANFGLLRILLTLLYKLEPQKACSTCSQSLSEDSILPNLSLRAAVQAFRREEDTLNRSSKRKRESVDQDMNSYADSLVDLSKGRSMHFPFAVTDRVVIKGNKRTPQRFVGREAVVTTQCLNGWYVVKTLDNAESVKLQYRSLAKVTSDLSSKPSSSKMAPSWLQS